TGRRVSSILVDNEAGGALAMRHLSELGHRRIAVVRGPQELFDSEPRWAGIQRAAADAGIQINPRLVFQLPNLGDPISGFEGGLQFSKQMLSSGCPFTAVLAFDDLTALGVVRGLTDAGVRVPENCSVLGFDDVLPAVVATPGMTTIRQPLQEMGLLAAEWVLRRIHASQKGLEKPSELHRATPELIVRMSTARPARSGRKKLES
ncbi:MAG TPA: substrate-binding domain-containing protein, partial [Acidobacteriaceae bacterium]|nr:substrate-binding domain-containing protein [Acidobacteriaceae bacterium]